MSFDPTPSQTVGPFFALGCDRLNLSELAGPGVAGERVEIRGRVVDGTGAGVPDAMLEVWQATSAGRYLHPEDAGETDADGFSGFGRIPTDAEGGFRFTTVKPGAVRGPGGKPQAPHIVVSVFMRGLLRRLVSRIYFAEEPGNATDYALSLVDPERRGTLVAKRLPGTGQFEWNVVLQGTNETVFFDIGL